MDIFKRMLVENPKVLAEFVASGLTEKHVKLVGEMIQPDKDPEKRAFPKRMFLYEVYIYIYIYITGSYNIIIFSCVKKKQHVYNYSNDQEN